MKKCFFENTEVLMKVVRLLSLLVAVLLLDAGLASAQTRCSNITRADSNNVRIMSVRGKSGDTVLVPFQVQNRYPMTSFLLAIKFDTAKVRPIPDDVGSGPDPNYVKWVAGPRLSAHLATSTVTAFHYVHFNQSVQSEDILNIFMLRTSTPGEIPDTIPPGTDELVYLPMIVQPGMRHLVDTGKFELFQEDKCFSIGNCIDGCIGAEYVEEVPAGSNIVEVSVTPILYGGPMLFVTDTIPAGPSLVFSSNDSSIVNCTPSVVNLSYVTSNYDSIIVTNTTTSQRVYKSTTSGSGSIPIIAGNTTSSGITATSTFQAVAYKGAQTTTKSITVTFTGSCGGGTGTAPSISTSALTYTVKEAETITFTATATDPDAGATITLGASSLPNNATFGPTNPRIGGSGISGDFSFTPQVGQKGTYQVILTATDETNKTSQRVITIVVEQLQFDRLFSTSAPGQSPVGGLRGTKGIRFPVNMISAQTVYGIQFDMTYPRNTITIDSIKPTSRIPEYAVYDNLGSTPGNIRVVTFGLNNEPVRTDTTSAILYMFCSIDSSAVPWNDAIMKMANGRESVNPDPNKPSLPLVTDSGIVQIDNPGDVNLDKYIDVGDVVNIVAYIIGTFPLSPRQFSTADVITNDSVNVFDLVGDINLIYGIPVAPAPPAPPVAPATVALAYNDMYSGSDQVMKVTSDLPTSIAGVQLEVDYDANSVTLGHPEVTPDYRNFILQYKDNGNGRMKIILYHGAGAAANPNDLIQTGAADLVYIPMTAKGNIIQGNKSQLRLTQALLSTPLSASVTVTGVDGNLPTTFMLQQNYPNPFNPTTIIQFSVGAAEGVSVPNVTLEIYNVLGQRVKTLVDTRMTPGDYKIEWDATSEGGQRVSSGVYFYRLQVDNQSQTKKMMFLK
jgi:hypothetical protein